ncbi:hypothetical protein G7Y79_00005g016920 [Physcia stellaris]|nr:hypothetical protein G7Y79_00005g016920 [Physcia stellaris]
MSLGALSLKLSTFAWVASSRGSYFSSFVALWISFHFLLCIYNIFIHPLRHYPGPPLGAATQLLNVYHIIKGDNCKYLCSLHNKYGDVVRTGPNELSFLTASAMKTIYGGKPAAAETFHKNMIANQQATGESDNLFFAVGDEHARYRRLVTPAFSESTIRAQEPMIQGYCDQMIEGLRSVSGVSHYPNKDRVVDMTPWTNFIVSDILSHMLFGKGLGCLKTAHSHPWVAAGYQALIESTYIEAAHRLWPYHSIIQYLLIPTQMRDSFQIHSAISHQKIKERAETEQPYEVDFSSFVSPFMSEQEVFDNINVIASAAGETTSSTVSSALYYLTHNPDAYQKLVAEIRGAFQVEKDITASSSASLPYLKATLRETFRIHPTIPVGLHRITPKKGRYIDNKWVPGATWVAVANLAACRSPRYWRDPERFLPERWLGAWEFDSDNRDMSAPYSIGVRNCIGMSHANTQLRIILSRLLWSFDFEAQPGNIDPHEYLEYGTWEVKPLKLRVTEMSPFILNPAEEYDLVVDRNDGLGRLFHDQVTENPDAVAVVDGDLSLTYSQLHSQSSHLALDLIQCSVSFEEPVGIVVQHGIGDVVAQLAIIYAGGTCATMDPTLQDQQIERRLRRLDARYLLVDDANKDRHLPFRQFSVSDLPIQQRGWYPVSTTLGHRTHLIHTSGTTSEPKIVQIAARSVMQVVFHAPFEPLRENDVVAHVNNSSFDVSLFDIWAPLLRGARIVVLTKAVLMDPPVMADFIKRHDITVMATTTAILNLAASTFARAFSRLRICFIGGEAANVAAIGTILDQGPPTMLINAYGPTECCVWCLAHRVTREDVQAGFVPVGMPIGRTITFIANETGNMSDEGELWIGGAGVSSGYLDQPEQNAASFTIIDNFVSPSGSPIRLYKTGDIVRRCANGQIEYIGRRDHQVKVRGFRIELAAVETALLKTSLFSQVVAMKIDAPQAAAGSMLVAYVVARDTINQPDLSKAIEALENTLPDYMIPQLELIDKLPLNSHGKVNRKELTELYRRRLDDIDVDGPQSESQGPRSTLAALWASILPTPVAPYEDTDDFFSLGGTSLQASLLISRIRGTFGIEVSLLTLYDNSTLSSLTSVIRDFQHGQSETVRNESEILVADTKIADGLPFPDGEVVDWCRDTEGRVFFTGATGFVGAFMLADLLRLPHIHQVGCLVRASDEATGRKRVRLALSKYMLWEDHFEHKLLLLPGLLEDEYLGLGPERFQEIACWASVVFHLGARVNYTQPYSLHRPANTLGTFNVVRFACAGRKKAIHYLSSISCFGPTGYINGATIVHEDEPLLPHLPALPYDHGYAQSQWVAEELLRRLIDRGFPIAIYRPGFITGHSWTGACNPDDFFSRLIHACCQIGYYPQLPNQRKEFVPVDYVSSATLHIAARISSLGHAYHIVPPFRNVSIDMDNSMELVSMFSGRPIQGVPYAEWVDRLASSPPGRLQPLEPMLAEKVLDGCTRWQLYENMPVYETKNTMEALADYRGGLEFPLFNSELVGKYLEWLQVRVVNSKPHREALNGSTNGATNGSANGAVNGFVADCSPEA